jgi:hypothetical protein
MPNQPHHMLAWKAALIASGNERHARRMKTQMSKSDLAEEKPPRFSGHLRHLECSFLPLANEAANHGAKPRTQRKFGYRIFLTFRSEADHVSGQIYISQRQTRFAKAAPLFPRNFVRNAHPFRFALEGAGDFAVFLDSDFVLWLRLVALDAETGARIRRGKSTFHRLMHHQTEEFYFEQGGVFCGFMDAELRTGHFPPLNEIPYLLPCELARNGNLVRSQKRLYVAPSGCVARECERVVGIPLPDKSRHPRGPQFVPSCLLRVGSLTHRQFVPELSGLTRLSGNITTQFRGFLATFARRINVFNPPKPGTFARVEGSHCRTL